MAQPSSSSHHPVSFSALLEEARAGNADVMAQLLEERREYLWMLANRSLNGELCAKEGPSDLVQDTIVAALRDFKQFKGTTPEEFTGWLCSILRHTFLTFVQHYRTQKRQVTREQSLDRCTRTAAEAWAGPSREQTPVEAVLFRELASILGECAEQLPEEHRAMMRMQFQDRLTFKKMGERLGITEQAARQRCIRAQSAFFKLIPPELADDPLLFGRPPRMRRSPH